MKENEIEMDNKIRTLGCKECGALFKCTRCMAEMVFGYDNEAKLCRYCYYPDKFTGIKKCYKENPKGRFAIKGE